MAISSPFTGFDAREGESALGSHTQAARLETCTNVLPETFAPVALVPEQSFVSNRIRFKRLF
jgi:hypothetical protein